MTGVGPNCGGNLTHILPRIAIREKNIRFAGLPRSLRYEYTLSVRECPPKPVDLSAAARMNCTVCRNAIIHRITATREIIGGGAPPGFASLAIGTLGILE
jgi:hypothetical protein